MYDMFLFLYWYWIRPIISKRPIVYVAQFNSLQIQSKEVDDNQSNIARYKDEIYH